MFKERQLQIRFFISLSLISICSVLVLATALYFWFREKTIDHVNQTNESVLLNTETVFTKYMDMVQKYTMGFYGNPNINTVMQSGDNSWSDQLYGALSQVRGTLSVNAFLENAYIMGSSEPVMMFENNPLDETAKQELFKLVSGSVIKQSPFVWNAARNDGTRESVMVAFYNDRAFDSSAYNGAIALTVNLRKLQANLFTDEGGDDTRYAVANRDGTVLMQNGAANTAFDEEMLQRIAEGTSKSGTLVWESEESGKLLITYRQAQTGGLWFLSETSYQNSIRDISNALRFMTVLCLSLMAAAAAVAAFVSHRLYKPIGTLFGSIRSLPGERAAFAHGTGFEEASRELDRFAEQYKALKRENEDGALLRWLTSPERAGEQQPAALPRMREGADHTAFCVAVLQLTRMDSAGVLQGETWSELVRSLPQIAERLFNGTVSCRAFFPHREAAVLIVSETEPGSLAQPNAYREHWEQLVYQVRSWPGVSSCCIGVSSASTDSGRLKQLYEEASDCLQVLKFQYRVPVGYAEDLQHASREPLPDNVAESVLQVIRNQEHELIPRAVERLLAAAGACRAEQAAIALSRLAGDLERIAESGMTERAARRDVVEHYQQIWRMRTYEELRAWLEQLCAQAYERMKELNTVHTRHVADEAIAYIRAHYGNPALSLNSLAEKLAISPSYLSKLITEATGASFPDFVNWVRLEHARDILTTELELDIKEVAERSGYNSSTYFTTLFKKRYGVTPSKWRLSHILQQRN
ncbi:AraC-like DNA-binding protein [Paenibacillus phyllosphaerae]|uniref:AraC-like DNA-binding protein n=1 Tax=Paenibacillus phyllosphaerae TaxID=274593 RepID=A0A7W5B353_9BACL|nr:helix-turn-helix domain-containing protein [Paenibacillus phyllosphaerae]MBB3113357.1 AraC-like DNA-binding protein [Paenibacillus phyllosphaerae]